MFIINSESIFLIEIILNKAKKKKPKAKFLKKLV